METKNIETKDDTVWIPFDEVHDYLEHISEGLKNISKGIKESLEVIDKKIGEQNDNDEN